jgi:hypothetical protein
MDEVQKRLQAMSDVYQKLQTGVLIPESRPLRRFQTDRHVY